MIRSFITQRCHVTSTTSCSADIRQVPFRYRSMFTSLASPGSKQTPLRQTLRQRPLAAGSKTY